MVCRMAIRFDLALTNHPIVINGNRAAIGRPPENVLAIL